jgi:hypothetical protein
MTFAKHSKLRLTAAALTCASFVALVHSGCGGDDGKEGSTIDTGGSAGYGAATGSGGSGAGIQTDGSAASSSGGSAASPNEDACASVEVAGTLVPSHLLFVVDRSGSMNCNLPSDGQTTAECEAKPAPEFPGLPSKWDLTRDALKTALDALSTAGNVGAGMVAFPIPASNCGVSTAPDVALQTLDSTQNAVMHSFLDGISPKGNTPLAGATILGYAYLFDQLKQKTLSGNLFLVLITDGFETCKASEISKLLSADVPNALLVNIRTFVIGVPGSEDGRALLSQMAFNGGTPGAPGCVHDASPQNVGDCHFDMTTTANLAQDLEAALAVIAGEALSCELDMPQPPPGAEIDYASVKVKNNGNEIPKDDSAPCGQGANGWQYNATKTKVFLCGSACDDAKKPGVKLSIDLGCVSGIH